MTDRPSTTSSRLEPTPDADRDWFGGRRWTGIGAIGVLIVAALSAGLLIFKGSGGGSAPAPAPAGPAAPPVTATEQQIPTNPPPDVTWSLYQSVALPKST